LIAAFVTPAIAPDTFASFVVRGAVIVSIGRLVVRVGGMMTPRTVSVAATTNSAADHTVDIELGRGFGGQQDKHG
jgi:hypothetical protein